MNFQAQSKLDARITELEQNLSELDARIQRLKALRDTIVADEEIAQELAFAFSEGPPGRQKSSASESPKSSQLEKVRDFFSKNANAWSDTSEIAVGSGLKPHSVRQLLYSRYAEHFDRREHPENKARKQFRLKRTIQKAK